jgi:cytochrome P450
MRGLMAPMVIVATELDLFRIDPATREFTRAEWHGIVASARAKHPFLARAPFGFNVLTYADSVGILRDRRFHSAVAHLPELAGLDPQQAEQLSGRRSILGTEGDAHGRLRRLVAPAFTPKAADRLRPFMREVVDGLVEAFAERGRCEFVADVCEPYPIPIICELLGAPKSDWKLFSAWATDLLRIFNMDLANDLPRIVAARAALDDYLGALIVERRAAPRADLLSDLIAVEEAGDRLSSEELLSMAEAVLVAGTDTTRNQLACAVAVFTDHPDQWALLAAHPDLAARAVEESMRYLGAVRGTARIASEDVEYKGIVFPQGTFLFPSFVAGNFDDAVWTAPDRFDITKDAPSTPQLTFGSGIHYCLGAWLARAELQEALPLLARRLPNLALDGEITWKPSQFGIWGPERLPIRFG